MYHLLAVDDDKAVLEMLKDGIEWQTLGIDRVYTAQDSMKAQEIIENNKIHLLLCDIEMPGDNGLELLEWIRNKNYPVITLFLTGFASFEYAQKAISLGSLDYLLKPISFKALKEALKKAVLRLELEEMVQRNKKSAAYGSGQLAGEILAAQNQDKFWEDILCIHHGGSRDFVAHSAKNYGIENAVDEKFVLICGAAGTFWGGERQNLPKLEKCRGQIMEIFGECCYWVTVIEEMLVLVCRPGLSGSSLSQKCKLLIEFFSFHFDVNVSFYIGEETRIERLYRQLTMLRFIKKENVSVNRIYFLNYWKREKLAYTQPDFNLWGQILITGNGEQLYETIHEYTELCRHGGQFTREIREAFFHDFLQMLYSVLKQKGIWANSLFESQEARSVFDNAMRSYEDLELNLWILCNEASVLLSADKAALNSIDQAKAYIDEHIFSDFSREDVAAHIHMSPEHLSRQFKKAEGMTLVDYIQMKKIEAARELLKSTRLSVGEIALRVGYKNFAYFSGIFKKYTGQTPLNYRKNAYESKNHDFSGGNKA